MNGSGDRLRDLVAARALHARLRGLGDVAAPAGLLGTVLGALGLAERFVSLESPIGTIFVAFADGAITGVATAPAVLTHRQPGWMLLDQAGQPDPWMRYADRGREPPDTPPPILPA